MINSTNNNMLVTNRGTTNPLNTSTSNATNNTTSSSTSLTQNTDDAHVNPNGILGKDDFMKLLLLELQYQDPTEPMDTEKILEQTSELASLESSDNTRKTLEQLSTSLERSQQFSTVSTIGKIASLGSDSIQHTQGRSDRFEMYFPNDVKDGTLSIKDSRGNVVKTVTLNRKSSGVYSFTWDGKNNQGQTVDSGIYHITANYHDNQNNSHTTAIGSYPVESVKFENGQSLLKLGSNYVPLSQIKEIRR